MLPDVAGIAALGKTFDYLVPPELERDVTVGTIVRVGLGRRRVGGWVVGTDVVPPPGVQPVAILKVSSIGPDPELVALSEWAARRWAGRRSAFLRTASPPIMVRRLPPPAPAGIAVPAVKGENATLAAGALAAIRSVVRLPPAADPFGLLVALMARGPLLVLVPEAERARRLAGRLRANGLPVALLPRDWALAAAGGCTVVGARSAAWSPAPDAATMVVLDSHDEALVEERAPTWSAWEVVSERAARRNIPCILVSSCPSLEQLAWGELIRTDRLTERDGWAPVHVIDRRRADPREGLVSHSLVDVLRQATTRRRVVCVLNRKGRAALLICAACGAPQRCERCDAGVVEEETGLRCSRCRLERPVVCQACGAQRLRRLRPGVARLREELEALASLPVSQVSAETAPGGTRETAPILVGTEAVLHRAEAVGVVAFLDFDAELLAPRYRGAEQALHLLARASRLVGGRQRGGLVLVQARLVDHPVLRAATRADPEELSRADQVIRSQLRLPPFAALAAVSGPGADAVANAIAGENGLEVSERGAPAKPLWLVRAPDHAVLAEALARAPRGPRTRIEVDPLRI